MHSVSRDGRYTRGTKRVIKRQLTDDENKEALRALCAVFRHIKRTQFSEKCDPTAGQPLSPLRSIEMNKTLTDTIGVLPFVTLLPSEDFLLDRVSHFPSLKFLKTDKETLSSHKPQRNNIFLEFFFFSRILNSLSRQRGETNGRLITKF